MRPDLAEELSSYLGAHPAQDNPLDGLSIGEIGVVYEALVALSDHRSRKNQGQYFTPDDVAAFMARRAGLFPTGRWLDPCCGVGNLSFHLASAMSDPAQFVAERLTLGDLDPVALKTAVALIGANFCEDAQSLRALSERSQVEDFLSKDALPPPHDFVIVNPPYARSKRLKEFRTAATGELYAYFLEKVIGSSSGFVSITPASFLSGIKFASLRDLLSSIAGGRTYVFDNVPDTCFRGYKYGSTNTSKTNFVRAAITVAMPTDKQWMITPILRWTSRSRERMWSGVDDLLVPLRMGPRGEWAKVMPETTALWDAVQSSNATLADLVSREPTPFRLHVASTPRYYVSATKRALDRGSVHVLNFPTQEELERAYLVLNSSLAYWWWRCIDGGITLPRRVLLSTPVPDFPSSAALVHLLETSEAQDVVTKLNAGRHNENVRRPAELVQAIDDHVLPRVDHSFARVFSSDMFAG